MSVCFLDFLRPLRMDRYVSNGVESRDTNRQILALWSEPSLEALRILFFVHGLRGGFTWWTGLCCEVGMADNWAGDSVVHLFQWAPQIVILERGPE